ncbi:sensor histidine kinase, partial [Massilia pinisoli]|uniref:sensor histidine kinase n=1 Tax=Massilia pinisoli TaxID=1772194 RepID=UPI003636A76A
GAAVIGGAGLAWRAARACATPAAPLEALLPAPPDTARADRLDTWLEFAPVALFTLDTPNAAGAPHPLNTAARRLLAPGRIVDRDGFGRQLGDLAADRRTVLAIDTEHGIERALAGAVDLTLEGRPQRLVAVSPVENELEAEAMQAWQKLVHVLTHEIMNSLTPVASLSQTARDLVQDAPGLAPDTAADLDTALDAIGRRATSLAAFVTGYRSLASVPEPRPERIRVHDLFMRLQAMVGGAWAERGGEARFTVEPANLELVADAGQLEQALVNLANNALDATAGLARPQLTFSARLARGAQLRIEVTDNGPGVPDELVRQIFTPFFTTHANGSGIGLAMVRQLVHRNGGRVRYARGLAGGARFVMTF